MAKRRYRRGPVKRALARTDRRVNKLTGGDGRTYVSRRAGRGIARTVGIKAETGTTIVHGVLGVAAGGIARKLGASTGKSIAIGSLLTLFLETF